MSIIDLQSPWLRHPRIWWTIGAFMLVFAVGNWLWGRDPPTKIGAQYNVPEVAAGQRVHIVVPVYRQLGRHCSVDISRSFISSEHARALLTARQHVSWEGLEAREKDTPGQLVIDVLVPAGAPLGMSEIETENQYTCPFNPSTWLWPIEDRWTFRFMVVKAT